MTICRDGWERRLMLAAAAYEGDTGSHYDDVFWEVSVRVRESGSAGKLDVAALAVWKRSAQGSRWIKMLMLLPERDVRRHTAAAFAAGTDDARLRLLSPVPGLTSSGPLATALLCAHDPVEFAVMDRRSLKGLRLLGCELSAALRGRARTVAYFALARDLRQGVRRLGGEFTARDVDRGLYILGG